MRLAGPWVERQPGTRAWRVRWRLVGDDGRAIKEPKRSGFATKAMADVFAENVQKAALRAEGWHFDARYHPTHEADAVRERCSVVAAVRAYALAHFPGCKPAQRTKIASVLAQLVAETLDTHKHRADVLAGLAVTAETRRRLEDPGAAEPTARPTRRQRVALALRDVVLVADAWDDGHAVPDAFAEELAWLETHSADVSALDATVWRRVWQRLVTGRPYGTARTYWAVVTAWVHWLVTTDRCATDPLAGFSTVARDPDAEDVDPERVPDRVEWERIAQRFDARYGPLEALFVLVIGYAALRLGEGLDLRLGDFFWRHGRWWVRIMAQHSRTTGRHARDRSDGRQPTKERRSLTPVFVPLPTHMNAAVRAALAAQPDADADEPLFRGPRGARLSADTFRDSHWRRVVGELFHDGHRLAGITPHIGRHFGMTNWLRSGVDPARCARWGRWASLKVMLDTYAGVMPGDDTAALGRVDRGEYGGLDDPPAGGAGVPSDADPAPRHETATDAPDRTGVERSGRQCAGAAVIDLDAFRRRRRATA